MTASPLTFARIAERYLCSLDPEIALSPYRASLNHHWLPRLGTISYINFQDLLRAGDSRASI